PRFSVPRFSCGACGTCGAWEACRCRAPYSSVFTPHFREEYEEYEEYGRPTDPAPPAGRSPVTGSARPATRSRSGNGCPEGPGVGAHAPPFSTSHFRAEHEGA